MTNCQRRRRRPWPAHEALGLGSERWVCYRGFELLDTVFLRVQDGRGGAVETGGRLEDASGYEFRIDSARVVPRENGRIVRLDGLSFEAATTVTSTAMSTEVDVPEGQKVVIGKATPRTGGEALVLVIEAQGDSIIL